MLPPLPPPSLVLETLCVELRRICRNRLPDLCMTTPLETLPGFDSLRLVETLAHLETHFQVEIDTDRMEDLRTVGDMVHLIARQP